MRKHLRTIKQHGARIVRHPGFAVPLVTFMALVLVTVVGLTLASGGVPKLTAKNSNIVIVGHDKKEQVIPTDAKTVGDLLRRMKITLNTGDVVEPALDTEIVSDNFRVNVYRAVPVTIVDGDRKTFVYSAATTPRSIAKQAGLTVYPEDDLQLLPTNNFLTESSIGQRVVIERSYPITVNMYGAFVPTRTRATTVAGFLKEKNIKLTGGDSVIPAQTTPLNGGATQIFVTHKGVQIQTAEEEIAMPTETVMDKSLSFGATAVRQQGSPGKKLITYQVNIKTGEKTRLQDVVVQQPVPQIVAKGSYVNITGDKTAIMAAAGISPGDYMYVDYIFSHESHWNPASTSRNGCIGLGQNCPDANGSRWLEKSCPNWQTDVICQIKRFSVYADAKGGWAAAYNIKVSKGWW
jgi:resuscitation-promoting factor RpfB